MRRAATTRDNVIALVGWAAQAARHPVRTTGQTIGWSLGLAKGTTKSVAGLVTEGTVPMPAADPAPVHVPEQRHADVPTTPDTVLAVDREVTLEPPVDIVEQVLAAEAERARAAGIRGADLQEPEARLDDAQAAEVEALAAQFPQHEADFDRTTIGLGRDAARRHVDPPDPRRS